MEVTTKNTLLQYSIFRLLGCVSIALFLLWVPKVSAAAEITIETEAQAYQVGDSITATVVVETQNYEIGQLQSVAGVINYTSDSLNLRSIDIEDSVFDYWVTPPRPDEENAIAFEGVVFEGVNQATATLFTFTFEATELGEVFITIDDIVLLGAQQEVMELIGESLVFSVQVVENNSEPVSEKQDTERIVPELYFDGQVLSRGSIRKAIPPLLPGRYLLSVVTGNSNLVTQVPVLVDPSYKQLAILFAMTTIGFCLLLLIAMVVIYFLWKQIKQPVSAKSTAKETTTPVSRSLVTARSDSGTSSKKPTKKKVVVKKSTAKTKITPSKKPTKKKTAAKKAAAKKKISVTRKKQPKAKTKPTTASQTRKQKQV